MLPARSTAFDYDTQTSIRTVDLKIQLSTVCSGFDWVEVITGALRVCAIGYIWLCGEIGYDVSL
jgi:hypothetical protein